MNSKLICYETLFEVCVMQPSLGCDTEESLGVILRKSECDA